MDGAEELLEVLEELSTLAWGLSAEVVIFFIVYALLYVAISIFALVQCIYFAITCSNVSPISKLGNLGTVIITLVSLSLLTSLSDRLGNMFPFGTFFDGEVITFTTNVYYTFNKADEVGFQFIFSSPIFMAIFSCLSNIPITYMIKNKVNIK